MARNARHLTEELRECLELLKAVEAKDMSAPFAEPVDWSVSCFML
jgi:hypothetical protein